MPENWLELLHEWHDFYLLLGIAAAVLTGLMFVVVTVGMRIVASRSVGSMRAFVTLTTIHFTSVLAVSALMLVPAMRYTTLAGLLMLGSIAALIYMYSIGVHRQWRESDLDAADWIGYVGLPILAYLIFLGAAAAVWAQTARAFQSMGGAAILLLVVGIRNAWDLVIWMTRQSRGAPD